MTVITKGKKIVELWNSSINFQRDYLRRREELKLDVTKLHSGIYTRWNSHIKLVRSLITNKRILCDLANDYKFQMLTTEEWKFASSILQVMEVFELALLRVEASFTASINMLFALMLRLKHVLDEKNVFGGDIHGPIIDKYFGISDSPQNTISSCELLVICAFLDPRTKDFLYAPAGWQSHLKDYCKSYFESNTTSSQQTASPGRRGRAKSLLYDGIYSKVKLVSNISEELERYCGLPAPVLNELEIKDILEWWKFHQIQFPLLSAHARDLLAI